MKPVLVIAAAFVLALVVIEAYLRGFDAGARQPVQEGPLGD